MKRPACSERQTGACRSYGVAVRQPCRGHEEPVEATDLSATGRRTPTDQVRTRRRERPVPESNGESDHSQPADWFPTEGAINPDRQAGVQRKKRSTPIAERVSSGRRTNVKLQPPDLDRGRRAKSTPSFRSVLPAKDQRQTPLQQQFPRGRPGESESSSRQTRATGITHPGFYGRKPWKKPNSAVIIDVPRPAKEGLRRPFRRLPPNRSQNLTANPSHPRPRYRHNRPRLSLFRSSRFLIALRVSKSAV